MQNLLKYGSKVRDIRVSLVVVRVRVGSGLGSVVAVACRFLSTGSAHSVDVLINYIPAPYCRPPSLSHVGVLSKRLDRSNYCC